MAFPVLRLSPRSAKVTVMLHGVGSGQTVILMLVLMLVLVGLFVVV